MCVAMPGTVMDVGDHTAVVDFGGNRVEARSGLVDVRTGDRVLVHAGCILQRISGEEADEMEALFSEMFPSETDRDKSPAHGG